MKKRLLKQLFNALIIGFILISCDKDADRIESTAPLDSKESYQKSTSNDIDNLLVEYTQKYNGEYVKTNFIGRIINENDEPIEGAKVTLGGQSKETDENGIVYFSEVKVQQYFAHIRAFAEGYLEGSRVIVPDLDKDSQNNFTIKLFRFKEVARISSKKGGKVKFNSVKGEGAVYFDSGFVDASGNPYNGGVSVSVHYLDPLDPDTANTMPGDLYGITRNFEEAALGSYGMIQVELRGDSGEKLQIINPATIRIPIHPDQIATATNQVPMWSFNEQAGVWYEEAIAYKDNNHYVAEVRHFSFWNCDAPFPVVNFSATVVDSATLTPISGLRVEITYSGFTRYANTDAAGVVSGKIPANQIMTLEIFDECGNLLHSDSSFGPYGGTTNVTIQVTPNPIQSFTLSGTVTNCLAAPVTNGYLTLTNTLSGQYITGIAVTGGTYTYSGIGCVLPSDITITAVDLATAQGSTTLTTVNAGANTQNIVICGGLASEYIRYRINTTTGPFQYDLLQPFGAIRNTAAFVQASNSIGKTHIYSTTIIPGTGYPFGTGPNSMYIETLSDVNGLDGNATMALATPMTFDLIAIGGIGQYILIEFSGNYVDLNGVTNTIEGEARIYRDF